MFEFKLDQEVALSAGKGGGLDTGVHKVKIEAAFLGTTTNGNNVVDLEVEDANGAKATIYGMCIDKTWKSGAENHDYPKWQELALVAGMATGATAPVKRKDYNGVVTDAVVFTELTGKVLTLAIQVELGMNTKVTPNKETKKRKLTRSFFEDGKSMAEKQNGSEAKTSVNLASKITDYETKEYKAHKAGGDTAGTPTAESSEPAASDESLL